MRQGIIPGLTQIMGLELTDHVYSQAGDDDNIAGQPSPAQDGDDE